MTTTSDDQGWRKFDIDCQDAFPVSLAFTDNPRRLVSGERNSNHPGGRIRQYQVYPNVAQNAAQGSNTPLNGIDRVVTSKDGKWAVSVTGTSVTVTNMITKEVVGVEEHTSGVPVHAIDLSPGSTRFATGSEDQIVRIFSVNTGNLLFKLDKKHNNRVLGVKISPDGERLATAACGDPVWVFDFRPGGQTYRNLPVIYGLTLDALTAAQGPTHIPLGWHSDGERVFTVSSGKVVMFGRSDWYPSESIPASDASPLYLLATNGKIIACAAGRSLSFWSSHARSRIGPTITCPHSILSIALSSDDGYLACGSGDKKITVYALKDIIPLHAILDPTSRLPLMNVSYEAFQPWIEQDFGTTCGRMMRDIYPNYHTRANHALVRASLQEWYLAIDNAKKSLSAEPSIIGYIALALALIGQGQQEIALETFDTVFCTCSADEIRFLVLIKAILLFRCGKRENAITRVKGLIAVADNSEKYNCFQILGNMYLMQGDLEHTIESFESAQSLFFHRQGHHLVTILLIFGRSFEEHEITIRHPLRGVVTA